MKFRNACAGAGKNEKAENDVLGKAVERCDQVRTISSLTFGKGNLCFLNTLVTVHTSQFINPPPPYNLEQLAEFRAQVEELRARLAQPCCSQGERERNDRVYSTDCTVHKYYITN